MSVRMSVTVTTPLFTAVPTDNQMQLGSTPDSCGANPSDADTNESARKAKHDSVPRTDKKRKQQGTAKTRKRTKKSSKAPVQADKEDATSPLFSVEDSPLTSREAANAASSSRLSSSGAAKPSDAATNEIAREAEHESTPRNEKKQERPTRTTRNRIKKKVGKEPIPTLPLFSEEDSPFPSQASRVPVGIHLEEEEEEDEIIEDFILDRKRSEWERAGVDKESLDNLCSLLASTYSTGVKAILLNGDEEGKPPSIKEVVERINRIPINNGKGGCLEGFLDEKLKDPIWVERNLNNRKIVESNERCSLANLQQTSMATEEERATSRGMVGKRMPGASPELYVECSHHQGKKTMIDIGKFIPLHCYHSMCSAVTQSFILIH